MKVKIKDYTYIDVSAKGDTIQKKVIGQELKNVYPQAVTTNNTEVVPDIMKLAVINNRKVYLKNHGLETGERIEIVFEDDHKEIFEISEATPDTFHVPTDYNGQVFVYGREVNDFHIVNIEALTTLNISATQQIYKEFIELKEEVQRLREQIKILQTDAYRSPEFGVQSKSALSSGHE